MKFILTVVLSGLLALSGMASAQMMQHGSMQGGSMQGDMMQNGNMQHHHGAGMVNKVDMHNGVVNLTHGPIKSLGWMGMTMDFKVKDKAILKGIQAGEKVKFEVVKDGPGKFAIVHIEASK